MKNNVPSDQAISVLRSIYDMFKPIHRKFLLSSAKSTFPSVLVPAWILHHTRKKQNDSIGSISMLLGRGAIL